MPQENLEQRIMNKVNLMLGIATVGGSILSLGIAGISYATGHKEIGDYASDAAYVLGFGAGTWAIWPSRPF